MPAESEPASSTGQLDDRPGWALDWQQAATHPRAWPWSSPTAAAPCWWRCPGSPTAPGCARSTHDQRWQIGSISKAFTSIAVLQLAGAGPALGAATACARPPAVGVTTCAPTSPCTT